MVVHHELHGCVENKCQIDKIRAQACLRVVLEELSRETSHSTGTAVYV